MSGRYCVAMSEVTDRYGAIADGFEARLRGVAPDGWSASSPCTDWTARDVATHVIQTHRRVRSSVDGSEPVDVDTEGDLRAQWAVARAAIDEALADPALSSKTIGGVFGEQPFESLVSRLLCADTLVHTWDLARATGQPEALDPSGVAEAAAFLSTIDEAIRRPGGFAPKIDPAPGADEQTAFLNFCGRAG
jgi:uncharacterized protein (TIGR03086 family)